LFLSDSKRIGKKLARAHTNTHIHAHKHTRTCKHMALALVCVAHALTCTHFTVSFARKASAEGKFKVDKKLLAPAVMQFEAQKRVSACLCVLACLRERVKIKRLYVCVRVCMLLWARVRARIKGLRASVTSLIEA
jgi:hypothetical protein